MLNARDRKIATQLKKQVEIITPIKRMIVFGSRARGKAQRDSDMDVFIELSAVTPELRQQIMTSAWEVSLEQGVVISIFLTSTLLLSSSPLAGNPILRAIETEGIAV